MSRPGDVVDHEAFAAGRAEAEDDIAAGRLCVREYGKVVPWWPDAAALLKSEYGVDFVVVGGCITMRDVASKADGYNQRMMEEVQSRYGRDVVEATFRQVERKRKKFRSR